MNARRVRLRFLILGLLSLGLQAGSATWLVRDFDTPNASTAVARSLMTSGRYAASMGGRLWGPGSIRAKTPLRSFVLPGEPFYLAASFRVLPPSALPYIHLPVTLLLIASVVAFAMILGGTRLAFATGLIASLQPFVVIHGPVWDDTFLAASLEWLALALLASALHSSKARSVASPTVVAVVAAAALAVAAVTRGDVLLFVALLVILVIAVAPLRKIRGLVILCATACALAISAWGLRNRAALGSFELGSSHDGITLWESNGPYTAEALRYGQVMWLSLDSARMRPYWLDTQSLNEAETNRYFKRRALQSMVTHPVPTLRLWTRKVLFTLTGVRPELDLSSARNLVAILSNAVTLALTMVGLMTLRAGALESRRAFEPAALLLIPLVATAFVVLLIGPIGMRYRIALDGVLWICAAAGALRIQQAIGPKGGHHADSDPLPVS
jgi:hypothetical protein